MERFEPIGRTRRIVAWSVAMLADALQVVLFPLFWPGFLSPWDDALDVAVGGALVALLGWHWAFAPSFVAKVVPGLDLVPTWTAAVFLATRSRSGGRRSRINLT
jgi:hypothetical protein